MIVKLLCAAALVAAPVPASAPDAPTQRCSQPVAVPQTPNIAANSTYYSDGRLPVRFRKNNRVMVHFADQAGIEAMCGKPPCFMIMLGCQSDSPRVMTLPNPCSYPSDDSYAQLACHELGHLNGWPSTHGD